MKLAVTIFAAIIIGIMVKLLIGIASDVGFLPVFASVGSVMVIEFVLGFWKAAIRDISI